MSNIKMYDLDKGVSLCLIKNTKFKSNLMSIYFQRNLNREDVTKISLLSNLMSVGCEKYPTLKDISRRTDELYGLSMSSGVIKHGEKSISCFRFRSVSDKYLDNPIFEEIVDFANEIVSKPLVIDNKLNPKAIEIEKENLKDEIKARINDKKSYATLRCIETMCKGEVYEIDEVGYEEDLASITAEGMYEAYKKLISTSRILITIEGDIDEEKALEICKKKFIFDRAVIEDIKREDFKKEVGETKHITEILKVNQGKLVMGYRTGVDYMDLKKYYSLMVGNSILGGGAHSKLFNNVREKESLCYYAASGLEKNKGLMIISSGIEVNNYEKAVELIEKEVKDTIEGKFDEEDINIAKRAIINALRSSCDNLSGEAMFIFNQYISKTNLKLEEVIGYIEDVSKEDIIEAMSEIQQDTIYYLR